MKIMKSSNTKMCNFSNALLWEIYFNINQIKIYPVNGYLKEKLKLAEVKFILRSYTQYRTQ